MNKLVNNVTLGADPELFLTDGNEIISAEGIIGGTKNEPKQISEEGHAIQEDNIMVEFNIPASKTIVEFRDNINFVLDYLKTYTKQFNFELLVSASEEINSKYLNTEQAKTFGCEPDFNVYLKDVNEPPTAASNLRTCGGHIHIGYENPKIETSELIVYAMDMVLGLESMALDTDDRRREMYGKAGCFRVKDYGVEYRTLSNFWIKNDELIEWAYNKTIEAIELVNSGTLQLFLSKFENRIRECIDTNNKEEALVLLSEIKKVKQNNLIKTN